MLQETRLHRIRGLLSSLGQVSTERIAQDLGVSRETVRRDLLALEAEGGLRRVHGGIVATGGQAEPPLAVRQTVRAKEKRAIARAAARLVQAGQTLFVDAGSTTAILAEELAAMTGITVITNGLLVAQKMAAVHVTRPANHVILLGGQVSASLAATCGDVTISDIHRYHADIALLSPVGVSAEHGATSFDHAEAAVARAMAGRAKRLIILADHSKLGHASRVAYAPAADIDVVVTNRHKGKAADRAALQAARVEVVQA
ncbi:DeoR/GlpR family DNA-binding transcription regulator [Bordetella hinzii]|uniref:DeoR/GlpR family DNA-binding transcription regulator n=1 Tax=Bordetella hinzii TaxID=103855 RepID=UPI00114F482A|nr:DeoR/GlpR family DNA-binding transcription regulator [Bordetella hinzii]QDJ52648.1 alkaline phosphatase [Bordetella hinzii]